MAWREHADRTRARRFPRLGMATFGDRTVYCSRTDRKCDFGTAALRRQCGNFTGRADHFGRILDLALGPARIVNGYSVDRLSRRTRKIRSTVAVYYGADER